MGASLITDTPTPTTKKSGHRSDIQGLRAILMAQVLLFHAWSVGSPIGVDAFIMISAYLMTSSFIRRSEAGRMPFFIERWGHTFKRLLPPLVIVVLATLGASLWILPPDRWMETTIQSFASLTYWENWRLVEVAADYYANDHALSSPLQHLWSMSMQGQVFLLWPVLMTVCVVVARTLKANIRQLVAVAFALLTVGSLLWLLFLAPSDGSVYFDTRARIWEFAFGSTIAALAPWLRIKGKAADILALVAFAVLLLFCLVSIGEYPGPMAFIPMISVSALLLYLPFASGPTGGAHPVAAILQARPLVALGDISYAVYLVHWPIFVLFLAYRGQERLGIGSGILLIAVSIVVAALLTKAVDDPLRHLPWANQSTKNKYLMVVLWLLIGIIPVAGVYGWLTVKINQLQGEAEYVVPEGGDDLTQPASGPGSAEYPGAWVILGDAPSNFTEDPIPNELLPHAYATFPDQCPQDVKDEFGSGKNSSCRQYGDPEDVSRRVFIAGNSHAQQLLIPAVELLMARYDWAGEAVLRGACAWGIPDAYEGECVEHNTKVLERVYQYEPDYVFLIATRTAPDSTDEILIPGVVPLVEELTANGMEVVALRDNLRSESNLAECSNERPADGPFGGCLLEEDKFFGHDDLLDPLRSVPGVHVVDMTDAYCTDGVCPTIIGNINVYLDSNHVTKQYSQSVAPFFASRVEEILGL